MAQQKKKQPADLSNVISAENTTSVDLSKKTSGNVRISDGAIVNVKSNVFGELKYIDPITKETVVWPQCGTIQQLPMSMLRHMKTGAVKFFTNQLIVMIGFADENAEKYTPADIYEALYVTQYYKNYIDPSDYKDICSWSPSEINEKISMLTSSAKIKLVVVLNEYIEKGILDSIKTIRAFEKALGCELLSAD